MLRDGAAPVVGAAPPQIAMRQILHLLIVDCARRLAAVSIHGSRWLLPVATCRESTRAMPPIARWQARRGLSGDIAGQWLGRVAPDAIDWIVPIAATTSDLTSDRALEWRSLDTLASDLAVLDYQGWAIPRTLARGPLPRLDGPFGNLGWPDEVRAWIRDVAGAEVRSLTPFRVGAHEVVVGAGHGGARVYFKGLERERAVEARLTVACAAVAPESFARTLAFEPRHDGQVWWLTADCQGRPAQDGHRAARALARTQQRLQVGPGLGELTGLDLSAAARWASDLLGECASADCLKRHCTQVTGTNVASTWVPMDLDPANILVGDDERVRFIDLDDSFIGPAPLAMAVLAMRFADRTLYPTYERSWSPPLAALDWAAFEIAATAVQFWLGWQRLEANIARGQVFIDRAFAARRTRDRLVRVLDGISRRPARPDDRGV